MTKTEDKCEVYLEVGKKRVFAGALHWPGWLRSGKTEEDALEMLFETGKCYEQAIEGSGLGFKAPKEEASLVVVERLEGGATTDFGAPEAIPTWDDRPASEEDFQRYRALLQACWETYDRAVKAAQGKELRKGPRGGGREVEGIIHHLLDADAGYLSRVGGKIKLDDGLPLEQKLKQAREKILETLASPPEGGYPLPGPRGGSRWPYPYYARRAAWHILDHAWEIEDRIL